jgi:hypothetical protein
MKRWKLVVIVMLALVSAMAWVSFFAMIWLAILGVGLNTDVVGNPLASTLITGTVALLWLASTVDKVAVDEDDRDEEEVEACQ